jgi:hypothetical protein
MHSVEESLLQSHHSVGSETDAVIQSEAKAAQSEETHETGKEKEKERGRLMRPVKRKKRSRINEEAICIQSKKACYEAAIQSEAKPTLPQEEKEQAVERDRKG